MFDPTHSDAEIDQNPRTGVLLLLGVIVVLTAIEILFYPSLCRTLWHLFTGEHGWNASSLRVFQLLYVLPTGLTFIVLSGGATFLTYRSPGTARVVLILLLVVNVLLFGFSLYWFSTPPA